MNNNLLDKPDDKELHEWRPWIIVLSTAAILIIIGFMPLFFLMQTPDIPIEETPQALPLPTDSIPTQDTLDF